MIHFPAARISASRGRIRRENLLIWRIPTMIYRVLEDIPGGWEWDFWNVNRNSTYKYKMYKAYFTTVTHV